jgi:hypothetical protein
MEQPSLTPLKFSGVSDPSPTKRGLVAAYYFDTPNGTVISDSSGNNYTGTAVGAVKYAPGVNGGQSISLAGAEYVSANSNLYKSTPASSETIMGWFRPSNLTTQQYLWETGVDESYTLSGRLETTGQLSIFSRIGGGAIPLDNLVIGASAGDWMHVAEVIDPTGVVRAYYNGRLIKTLAWNSYTISATSTFNTNADLTVQGVTTDGTNTYVSYQTKIEKYNASNELVASSDALTYHIGDIHYYDGVIYAPWSDGSWTIGCPSKIKTYNATDLSFIEEFDITGYAGMGCGAISRDPNTGHFIVGESHTSTTRQDHIFEFDDEFNFIAEHQPDFLSYWGIQGISYYNGGYLVTSHTTDFYRLDAGFKVQWAGTSTFSLQGIEYTSAGNVLFADIGAKQIKTGTLEDPGSSLYSWTALNIGADRYNARNFYGQIDKVKVFNVSLTSDEILNEYQYR